MIKIKFALVEWTKTKWKMENCLFSIVVDSTTLEFIKVEKSQQFIIVAFYLSDCKRIVYVIKF